MKMLNLAITDLATDTDLGEIFQSSGIFDFLKSAYKFILMIVSYFLGK